MPNEEIELFNLMAAETSAIRLFYVFNLLEKLVCMLKERQCKIYCLD
jgi:hypothetical protein